MLQFKFNQNTFIQHMSYVIPALIMLIGILIRRPALAAGVNFLLFGATHLYVNAFVCTYDVTLSPSPSPNGGPDIDSGFNGIARQYVNSYFAWSYTAFIIATVIGSMAIGSKFIKSLDTFSMIYPRHIIAKVILLGIGILGIIFNSISIKHTSKCNSREFDPLADHNYIPIISISAGFILIIVSLFTQTHNVIKAMKRQIYQT